MGFALPAAIGAKFATRLLSPGRRWLWRIPDDHDRTGYIVQEKINIKNRHLITALGRAAGQDFVLHKRYVASRSSRRFLPALANLSAFAASASPSSAELISHHPLRA